MAEEKKPTPEDLDRKLEELDRDFTPEKLRKLHKYNLLKKIRDGQTDLLPELERLEAYEKKKAAGKGEDEPEEGEEEGIPERLLVKKRRRYTLSREALEQRRRAGRSPAKSEAMKGNNNAWKTGQFAQGFVRQVFRPCLSTCECFPCSLVEENEVEPGDYCLDKAELVKNLQAVQTAMRDGKLDDFKDVAALRIAGGMEVVRELIEDVLGDGTILKSEIFNKDGAHLGYKIVSHPSLLPLAKLMEVLGLTPANYMITPKAVKYHEGDKEKAKTLAETFGEIGKALRKGRDAEPEE